MPSATNMRIFLVRTGRGLFASSGGCRADWVVLHHLASQGHVVQQFVLACEDDMERYRQKARAEEYELDVRRGWI